nr:unnamed protein product [Callosobruchus chinensis]
MIVSEEIAPNVENPYPGCSDLIQMSLKRKTIHDRGTMEIMVTAQSRNTLKQYNSTYSKWWDFCKGNIETILQPGVNEVLSFLKQQYDRGPQYSTLNVHRSALNLICDAGKSELVDRFMKGVFKLRPNFPRYEELWDPESVLKYIISLYPLNKLSLEDLTVRLVVLKSSQNPFLDNKYVIHSMATTPRHNTVAKGGVQMSKIIKL